ncbi:MAG: PAS domain S-box protein, partial [Burkholderiales bacterium]
HAEAIIRASRDEFQQMADTAPAMLWITEPDGYCTFLSRSWYEFTGQTPEEGHGLGWTNAIHPDESVAARRAFLVASERHGLYAIDFRLRRADGEYRWVIDTGRPRFGESGEFLGFIGSVVDIHERKLAEAALAERASALREADRRKDEFLAMLAHELRNPLASVTNAAALLQEGAEADEQRWAADVITRQSGQLSRLVDDLLDVSRITRGKIALRKVPLDVARALDGACEAIAPLIVERAHSLIKDFPSGELWVDADPARLEQIVGNLLANAARYTEPRGEIHLSARREQDSVVIAVRDSGIGIDPARIHEMFELFAQGERGIARSEGGLGIGLTIVRGLSEL